MDVTSADIRHMSCLWYAWGRIDSGEYSNATLAHGQKFADEQKEARRAYDAQENFCIQSLLEAWDDFVKREGIELKYQYVPPTA